MKENIDSKYIGNRRFILELRFDHKLQFLDRKGEIVDSFQKDKIFTVNHWEIGSSDITIRDNQNKDEAKNIVQITMNRLNYNSLKIDSIESFYDKFIKILKLTEKVLGELNIMRIGCRIIGSYYTKSKEYNQLLTNYKSVFPTNFLFDQYSAKDFLFNLSYQNGMYQIGPLSEDDSFYKREFNFDDCKKHVGLAIDTDNFITNEVKDINENKIPLIKDIYMLSLSVEKDLFSKLKNY